MARQTNRRSSYRTQEPVEVIPIALRLVVIISCAVAIVATVYGAWGASAPVDAISGIPLPHPTPTTSIDNRTPPEEPPPTPSPHPALATPHPTISPIPSSDDAPRIGIVAGHWGHDTGAMCPDGLREVDINLEVAKQVVDRLQTLGYQADLLAEYDPRLEGYQADALVSIHADSCQDFPNATPPASGFKVASVEDSMVPDVEDLLVACLAQCYAARTDMYFHTNSITYDMIYYHNFYEIDNQTPGAIIEIGFMKNDRAILTERTDLVAQGIVEGIVCFIESSRP